MFDTIKYTDDLSQIKRQKSQDPIKNNNNNNNFTPVSFKTCADRELKFKNMMKNKSNKSTALLTPSSCWQKNLDHELKRINQTQQQYEISCSYEERKLVTRMALKMVRSKSNLENVFMAKNAADDHLVLAAPQKESTLLSIKPSAKTNHRKESLFLLSSPPQSFKKVTKTSLYDLNKKYSDIRLRFPLTKPILILPRLVLDTKTFDSDTLNVKKNLNRTRNRNLERKFTEYRERFNKDILNDDSLNDQQEDKPRVFFSYTDNKGKPLCSGYDNYTESVKFYLNNGEETTKSSIEQQQVRPISVLQRSKTTLVATPSMMIEQNKLKKLADEKREDEKVMSDLCRAQYAKSLTFKSLNLE
jgi:hypothetical protein